ncbi:polyprotein of retroviral origin, putative [Ixodes scapularis]|uniref:Polyprotein of retroviral origin, putative n=2 Tax=Ixodes scapularis TaxID=6945 RepID=B7QGW2_IXOSC|nr:polyprotein of retroviral origin, putative [Ixodes scapularis]|eukprot:XP_002414419.1 polyprotein of retroviral origin, putative [Ixodes scapularis]
MPFIGLVNYYHKYIPQFCEKASPLTDALKKTEPTKIEWDDRKIHAFEALKLALATQPVLVSPDYTRPFLVQCDASEKGLGVVLSQENEGEEHPVLFASRKLTSREQAYSTIEKECACLVWAVEKLRCYLYGSEFILITDHRPLTWLQQLSPQNGRLLRWSLTLQEYSFLVRHKKEKLHANADYLSRAL